MANDLLSKRTRQLFFDLAVHLSLREIDRAFLSEDIDRNEQHQSGLNSQRRQRASEYLSTVDYTDAAQVKRVLLAMASALALVERLAANYPSDRNPYEVEIEIFCKALRKDGFEYVAEAEEIRPLASSPILAAAKQVAERFDMSVLKRQVSLIHDTAETRPGLAVGTSKNLVETVCKAICEERKIAVDRDWDVPKLVRVVQEELQLLPEAIKSDARGLEAIKKVLGSLANVANGLAALRNEYGEGHGDAPRKAGLEPRHAHLASGAASTLAVFLWNTHLHRAGKPKT